MLLLISHSLVDHEYKVDDNVEEGLEEDHQQAEDNTHHAAEDLGTQHWTTQLTAHDKRV